LEFKSEIIALPQRKKIPNDECLKYAKCQYAIFQYYNIQASIKSLDASRVNLYALIW